MNILKSPIALLAILLFVLTTFIAIGAPMAGHITNGGKQLLSFVLFIGWTCSIGLLYIYKNENKYHE